MSIAWASAIEKARRGPVRKRVRTPWTVPSVEGEGDAEEGRDVRADQDGGAGGVAAEGVRVLRAYLEGRGTAACGLDDEGTRGRVLRRQVLGPYAPLVRRAEDGRTAQPRGPLVGHHPVREPPVQHPGRPLQYGGPGPGGLAQQCRGHRVQQVHQRRVPGRLAEVRRGAGAALGRRRPRPGGLEHHEHGGTRLAARAQRGECRAYGNGGALLEMDRETAVAVTARHRRRL
jgi:hypothetical protein